MAKAFPSDQLATRTFIMTTAGIAGLIICQSELWKSRRFTGPMRRRTRDAIRDSFAWMQVNFDVTQNPGMGTGAHYYYLYGLERACVLARNRYIGEHDWYLDGAQVLLSQQQGDGSWGNGNVVEASFAILVLKRASFRIRAPVITPRDEPEGGG